MFIDNQILTEIGSISDSETLYGFLNRRSKYILPILENVIARINILSKTLDFSVDIFDILFFGRKEFIGYEFTILEQYVLSIDINNVPITTMSEKQRNLYLLLCSPAKIREWNDWPSSNSIEDETARHSVCEIWKNYQKDFLHSIFDMYIPSYEPIKVIDDVLDSGYGLSFMTHNNDKLPTDIFKSGDANNLYRYVRDIYDHAEMKQDAFVDMHNLTIITNNFIEKVYNVADRYKKYFNGKTDYDSNYDPTIDSIYKVFLIFSDSKFSMDVFDTVIINLKTKFILDGHTNMKVLELFLLEVLDIAYDLIDTYHYNAYRDKILELVYQDTTNEIQPEKDFESEVTNYATFDSVMEAYKKNSVDIHKTQNKIYKAYKNYKNNEDKVDSQLSKAVELGKKLLIGDVKTEVIEGKKFTAMGLLKTALGTAALFSLNWVAALIAIVVKYALKKSTTVSERRKIIMELETEIEMIDEKIEDARGDGNREAKYSMMRTRTELKNALAKIKYGMEADQKSVNTAKSTIRNVRSKW